MCLILGIVFDLVQLNDNTRPGTVELLRRTSDMRTLMRTGSGQTTVYLAGYLVNAIMETSIHSPVQLPHEI